MKRAGFKLQPDRGGWLRTTLCPINDKHESTFGAMDVCMFAALVLGTLAIARLLIAH
jgi:hypothetical protein